MVGDVVHDAMFERIRSTSGDGDYGTQMYDVVHDVMYR